MAVITIQAGQVSNPRHASPGEIISVKPGTGGSVLVEYTLGSAADIGNNVATWLTWPAGTVSVSTGLMVTEFIYIRVTATTAAAVLSTNPNPSPSDVAQFTTPWYSQNSGISASALPFTGLQLLGSGGYYNGADDGYGGYNWNARKIIPMPNGGRDIQVAFSNAQAGGEASTYAMTIAAAAMNAAGEVQQLTFNGAATYTFVLGTKAIVWSDPLPWSFLTGEILSLNIWAQPTSGNTLPVGMPLDATAGDRWSFNQTSVNQTMNTAFSFPDQATQSGQAYGYGPCAVIGIAGSKVASVGGLGDSIVAGTGDANHFGWMHRAFKGGSIPYVGLGMQGESAGIGQVGFSVRREALRYASKIINELCINNIIGNATLAGLQAIMIDNARRFAVSGQQVWQTTATPYTDSGNTAPQRDAVRAPYNAWIRAGAPITIVNGVYTAVAVGTVGAVLMGSATHPMFSFLEIAGSVEQGGVISPNGLWVASALTDGTHPSAAGASAIAATITPANYPKLFAA